jgi:hypothetical protein
MAAVLPYLARSAIAAATEVVIDATERLIWRMFIKRKKLNVPAIPLLRAATSNAAGHRCQH